MLYKYGEQTRDFGDVFIQCLVYFSIFWRRFLKKQLFHSRLLDMRLVIANSAIYHLISNARSWNNC